MWLSWITPPNFQTAPASSLIHKNGNPLSIYHHPSETPCSSIFQGGDRLFSIYHLIFIYHRLKWTCLHINISWYVNRSFNRGYFWFQGGKLQFHRLETKCFAAWNSLFQALKPIVSRHETLCFAICSKKAMPRNQRFLLENHSLNSATRALLTSIFSLIPE